MAFAAEAKHFGRPAETKALTRPMHPSRARAAGESPLRVRQTPSAFHPRAQQSAFLPQFAQQLFESQLAPLVGANAGRRVNSPAQGNFLRFDELRRGEESANLRGSSRTVKIMQKNRKISGRFQGQKRFAHAGLWN